MEYNHFLRAFHADDSRAYVNIALNGLQRPSVEYRLQTSRYLLADCSWTEKSLDTLRYGRKMFALMSVARLDTLITSRLS
jgi:hypothetical protein